MNSKKIQLWSDDNFATLTTYVLEDSKEFKTGKKRPAIIICPGGAYLGTSDREAEPVALKFSSIGYQTFVLRYNTLFKEFSMDPTVQKDTNPNSVFPQPLFDLAKAILTVRENSEEWFVDTDQITICGFSAGGNLVGNMSVFWDKPFLSEKLGVESSRLKPNAAILGYPVLDYLVMQEKLKSETDPQLEGLWNLSNLAAFGTNDPAILTEDKFKELSPLYHVTNQTPPTFIWHTAEDSLVYVENSLKYALELSAKKIPYELHVFEKGQHGLSLCDETTAADESQIMPDCGKWVEMAKRFLERRV